MITHAQLWALILLVVALFGASQWVLGGYFEITSIAVEVAVFGVAGVLGLFELWLWRANFLQSWFVRRPHIWGSWEVTMRSSWIDPTTKEQVGPISATFWIKQTCSTLFVRMFNEKSDGELVAANIVRKEDGGYRLVGTYRNEPKIFERPGSPIHYGSFILDIEGLPNCPTAMHGHYWTDRDTKGEIVVVNRDPKRIRC